MRQRTRTVLGLAAVALLTVSTIAVATSANATGKTTLSSDEALTLDDDGLILRIIELDDPDGQNFVDQATGFEGTDTKLIGIDYRVQDDKFYGVGDGGNGFSLIYTIDTKTGALTPVSELTVTLEGDHFGVDFNPAADRLRIISDTGQDLRHNLAGSTLEDGDLNYADVLATDVTGAAYTNNDLSGDTATSLLDIDTALNQVVLQQPPNDGDLVQLGRLGISVSEIAGFDIQSKVSGGRTVSNTGYAALRSSDTAQPDLFKIDLLSGKATKIDDLNKQIADIAVKQP